MKKLASIEFYNTDSRGRDHSRLLVQLLERFNEIVFQEMVGLNARKVLLNAQQVRHLSDALNKWLKENDVPDPEQPLWIDYLDS